jgi:hypothetical protein
MKRDTLEKLRIIWNQSIQLIEAICSILLIWVVVEIVVDSNSNLLFMFGVRVWVVCKLGAAIYDEYKRRRK